MRHHRTIPLAVVAILALAGLACATTTGDPLATAVAATLAAVDSVPTVPAIAPSATPVGEPGAADTTGPTPTTVAGSGGDSPTSAPPTDLPTAQTPPTETPVPDNPLTVAFVRDTGVWVWREDTQSATEIASGDQIYNLRISDDGQVVVYYRSIFIEGSERPFGELWAVNTDGSNARLLHDTSSLDYLNPDPAFAAVEPYQMDFLPGTHTLLMATRLGFQGPGLAPLNDLHQIDVDSGSMTTIHAPGQGGRYVLSPDGSRMVFSSPSEVWIALDGFANLQNVLTYANVITYSEYEFHAIPFWAEDGSRLRVVIPPADPLAEFPNTNRVYEFAPDGSPAYEIAQISSSPLFGDPTTFSPNLRYTAYTRNIGALEDNLFGLYAYDFDTGVETYLDEGISFIIGWTPDGTRLLYSRGPDNVTYIVAPGGSPTQVPLANTEFAPQLFWLDNNGFVYTAGGFDNWQVRLGSLDGSYDEAIGNLGEVYPVVAVAP